MRKVTRVGFYQAVYLGKNQLKQWAPDESMSDGVLKKGITAEVEDKGVLLSIESAGIAALVPWPNVAYIQFEIKPDEPKVEVKVKAEKAK